MKNVVLALALSLTVFNAQADCISKADESMATIRKNFSRANSLPGYLAAMAFNAAGPLVLGLYGTSFHHNRIYDLRHLLADAEANGGDNLDAFANAIKDSRPDLAEDKGRLAEILREANQKETICGNGFIYGTLLRTLVMGGDVEAANAENRKISVSDFNNNIDG